MNTGPRIHALVSPLLASALLISTLPPAPAGASSLRFFGNGVTAPTLDRVVIPLDTPARPVDVGVGDFTIELWLKATPGENGSAAICRGNNDDWIFGNIVLDRDVFFDGDWGDWGLSLMNGRVAFGAFSRLEPFGSTVCGTSDVTDGAWHHVARPPSPAGRRTAASRFTSTGRSRGPPPARRPT